MDRFTQVNWIDSSELDRTDSNQLDRFVQEDSSFNRIEFSHKIQFCQMANLLIKTMNTRKKKRKKNQVPGIPQRILTVLDRCKRSQAFIRLVKCGERNNREWAEKHRKQRNSHQAVQAAVSSTCALSKVGRKLFQRK